MLSNLIDRSEFVATVESMHLLPQTAEDFVKQDCDGMVRRALDYDPLADSDFKANAFDCAVAEIVEDHFATAIVAHYVMAHGTMIVDLFADISPDDIEMCAEEHGELAASFLLFVIARNSIMTDKGIPFGIAILGKIGQKLSSVLSQELVNIAQRRANIRKAMFIWSPTAMAGLSDVDKVEITTERISVDANL